ncbi:MAG: pyridoxamine 5'-phosphate oxidase family protein [Myxococcaceae bacterium]
MAATPSSDVAFTGSVKALQSQRGSRSAYARMEQQGGFATELTDDVADFIRAQTSVFFATANAAGQPYVQHRGGPAGFLHVLDGHTLAWAEYRGNRQFISQGNLADNPKAHLFLIDYQHRQRVKVWGEARVVTDDPALLARLSTNAGPKVKADQVIVFKVIAWDANCPAHIPQRLEAADVRAALEARDARIAALEKELATFRAK